MKLKLAILSLASAFSASLTHAQTTNPYQWELGAGYNFVTHQRAASGCGCFSMNGGNASVTRQSQDTSGSKPSSAA